MTGVAVVGDSLLHPFYPQYFALVFGVEDPTEVGVYVASCSLSVLLAFPFWASVARRIHVLDLLTGTQVAAGILCLVCSVLDSLPAFWFVSLLMMLCKASYLLLYPYALSSEGQRDHIGIIGLLAFVAYFGHVLSALLAGLVFQVFSARSLFVLMALGDAVQVALCLHWRRCHHARSAANAPGGSTPTKSVSAPMLLKFGVVMLVLYFSAYVSEPFFVRYWEDVSLGRNKLVSGVVFAIPAMAALGALLANRRASASGGPFPHIVRALAIGVVGLLLQATAALALVVAGRLLYGWALFQALVRLDGLLFSESTRESYAADFSKANVFQGVGVLAASASAGGLVSVWGPRAPFLVSAAGFALGAVLYLGLFRGDSTRARDTLQQGSPLGEV